jgi:glycine/D-amino acid oxidase-like deaminating enzyme
MAVSGVAGSRVYPVADATEPFVAGDAIVDSTRYVQAIARALGETRYRERSRVVELRDAGNAVEARLENGEAVTAAHAVVATNGFIIGRDANLQGRMRSYWTFLVAFDDAGENTPNAYYFDPHAHYWARQDDKLTPRSRASPAAGSGRCTTACSARRATTCRSSAASRRRAASGTSSATTATARAR